VIHKYLLKRGNIYYFRWRIPADIRHVIQLTELKFSLETSSLLEANARVALLALIIKEITSLRKIHNLKPSTNTDSLKNTIKGLTILAKDKKLSLITLGNLTVDYDGDAAKEVKVLRELLGVDEDEDAPLHIPFQKFEMSQTKTAGSVSKTNPILFSELYEKFIKHKKDPLIAIEERRNPISDNIKNEHKRYFSILKTIIGDLPIYEISNKLLKEAILSCRNLPKGNLKIYKGIKILELLEMDIPEKHRLKDKSVAQIKRTAQGMFKFAVDSNYIDVSPAANLGLKLDNKCTYGMYSDSEVNKMLIEAGKEKGWKKWIIFLAVFSGARRGEIAQLRVKDIKFDDDSERYYLHITDEAGSIKSKNAIRQIPIHSNLINKGFLKYTQSIKGTELFKGLTPDAITRWFTSFRDKNKIPKFDDFENRKVFHSFRHTFITKSRGAGNPIDHIQQVVGHEKINSGTTDRYSHRQPLKVVLPVVDKIVYE